MNGTEGEFVMTVGLPGSGKSTWANQRESEGWRVIRPDAIRWEVFREDFHALVEREVWTIVHASLKGLFKLYSHEGRGSSRVLLDATNLTRRVRSRWIRLAKAYSFRPKAVVFAVTLEECLRRNAGRTRQVPEDVLSRFHREWEFPWYTEGLCEIQVLGDVNEEILAKARLTVPHISEEEIGMLIRRGKPEDS